MSYIKIVEAVVSIYVARSLQTSFQLLKFNERLAYQRFSTSLPCQFPSGHFPVMLNGQENISLTLPAPSPRVVREMLEQVTRSGFDKNA
jgi:hypothetical protein